MGIEGRFPAVGFCVLARQGTQTGFLARLALIAALSAAVLYGQANRGVISGHVRDMSNAMIPEANVSAVHVSTGVASTARSNEAGEFSARALIESKSARALASIQPEH